MKTIILFLLLFLPLAQQHHTVPTPKKKAASTQPQEARILGLLDFNEPEGDVITLPKTVRVSEDFQVMITTYGGGCERAGDTGVVLSQTGATIMVYDFTVATHPGVACTMVFKRLPHTVTLRFTEPGEKVIQVWGRRAGGATTPLGTPVLLERKVTVQKH
ncbi:MAG TPA: hypothetical protein VFZ34_14565 [Blastocatellia bacterium]|nr:hypothetical protein [Blastocatellia bacterium]